MCRMPLIGQEFLAIGHSLGRILMSDFSPAAGTAVNHQDIDLADGTVVRRTQARNAICFA